MSESHAPRASQAAGGRRCLVVLPHEIGQADYDAEMDEHEPFEDATQPASPEQAAEAIAAWQKVLFDQCVNGALVLMSLSQPYHVSSVQNLRAHV